MEHLSEIAQDTIALGNFFKATPLDAAFKT